MSHGLKDYYNFRYTAEGLVAPNLAPENKTISIVDCPVNRYESALKIISGKLKGGDVLEIASGTGYMARSFLANDLDFATYTLSEYSDTCIPMLKQEFTDPRFSVISLDVEHLPENLTQKYDVIIMLALIEHLVDPVGALQQLRGLLKPGGFVYIDTPNIAKFTRRIRLLMGQFPSTAATDEGLTRYDGKPTALYDEGHFHYFTYRSLSRMLTEKCGYSKIETTGYACGYRLLGRRGDHLLARVWPKMFSDVALLAYR